MAKEPAYLRALKPPRYLEAVAKARRTTKPYAPPLPPAAQVQEALRRKALRQALVQQPPQA